MKLNPSNIAIIKRLLVGRNNRPLRSILSRLEAVDIASLFGQLSARETKQFLDALFSIDRAREALLELPDQQLTDTLQFLEQEQLLTLLIYGSEDDAAYFLHLISESKNSGEELVEELLEQLEKPKRERIRLFLNYPEDSAGRMMSTGAFCLSTELTAEEALEKLRSKAQTESIYYIYCTEPTEENHLGRLAGILSLRQLATAPAQVKLNELIKQDVVTVSPYSSTEEVAQTVSHYDFIAIPVVDKERNLLGIITIDDVLDIIQEQATADIYAHAGLQENDLVFSSARTKIKNRIPWMFLNLILAALASSVVSLFEQTMSHLIILASLKNIVAGMGGNTAIQTLTVVTRGLATGDFQFTSYAKAVIKETIVGLTIGVLMGGCAALLTYFWKGNFMVSIVIWISMILNSLVASTAGALVPIILKKSGKDPAIGSGVLVTMMTDIFSFFSFLGIATLGLKYFT